MAEFNQFGSVRLGQTADAKQCARFESMLTEAVDGTLSAEDQAAFDLHLVGCATCQEMLASAKRGAAWMEMLREHAPEPPAAMLERILAQTSGPTVANTGSVAAEIDPRAMPVSVSGLLEPGLGGAAAGSNVIPFRKPAARGIDFRGIGHTLLQPRLAMTAAMAFFSVALTLNLTGVRLSELRASDLKPSSLKRSMYEANAHVVRYYTNLRVVYELESRVHDLQRSSDDNTPSTQTVAPEANDPTPANQEKADPKIDPKTDPGAKDKKQEHEPRQRVSPGTSRREPMLPDQRVLAELRNSISPVLTSGRRDDVNGVAVALGSQERGTV